MNQINNIDSLLKENITPNTIESLNFIIYRGIDYFSRHFSFDSLNKNLLEDCYKNLDELSNIIETKILKDKILDSPILDPFSLMMHFARITNNNYLIWNYISNTFSLRKVLQHIHVSIHTQIPTCQFL